VQRQRKQEVGQCVCADGYWYEGTGYTSAHTRARKIDNAPFYTHPSFAAHTAASTFECTSSFL
jgi:hypothetical protein